MSNHYDTLGVWRDATPDEIDMRYQSLVERLADGLESAESEVRRAQLGEAHAVLMDPARRAAYDQALPAPASAAASAPNPRLAEQEIRRREREDKARKKQRQREREERKKVVEAFRRSPAGRARAAFNRGDHIFQFSLDVKDTKAIVVPMLSATTTSTTADPNEIVNSVCNEGWEPINASFVFHELGSESRDKFLASGQNIAVKGTVIGYYFFRRCNENRRDLPSLEEITVASAQQANEGVGD